jgi:hypothetical protein
MWTLQMFGLSGQDVILTGLPLAGVLLVAFVVTMLFCGGLGVMIERVTLRSGIGCKRGCWGRSRAVVASQQIDRAIYAQTPARAWR